MALHDIVFTVVNNRLFSKLSGARNQVGESVRPKGGSRGPSSRDGCGAPGNDADGFTPPEMFLACATATALGEGPFISSDRTFDGSEKERADWPLRHPDSAAHCRPGPYFLLRPVRRLARGYRHSERLL